LGVERPGDLILAFGTFIRLELPAKAITTDNAGTARNGHFFDLIQLLQM
jgi:hypothetical protein